MSAALDYTYRYPTPSRFERSQLTLATCSREQEHPHFFEGALRSPRAVADQLLVLTQVVRTHFFLRRPPNLDPVLTAGEGVLRVEGFSGCCGVYARVDLPEEAFDATIAGRGTTNVDFNEPMRAALARLRDSEAVKLSVGEREVSLARGAERTIEKKVKLPVRWLKGFSEVQAYGPTLAPALEVSAAEGLRFVRSLPRSSPKRPVWVVPAGRSLRLSQREGGVRLTGTHRLAVLEPLLPGARRLRAWQNDAGVSGWEVEGEAGRFFLMLSPEVFRGFSGEGQNLEALAEGTGAELVNRVRAELRWQSRLEPAAMASRLGLETHEVEGALRLLGARGAAGYDAASGCFFHRELPFDLSKVEELQPRLLAARKLASEGGVRLVERHGEESADFAVEGTRTTHFVRLRPEGDRCSCPWFSKHQGERGPCRHILAAQLAGE